MMRWVRQEFTMARWASDPFQMYATTFLGIFAQVQILRGLQLLRGSSGGTVLETEIDRHAQLIVSSTTLLGMVVCLVGLHMRDLSSALWIEVIGYVSLVGSLFIYVFLVGQKAGYLNSSPGYALVLAFCTASASRTLQIFLLKRAERRAEELRQLVARVDPDVADAGGGDI